MSPEAIRSLIKLFGIEKGIHILNMFTAMDDLELSQLYRLSKPRSAASGRLPRPEEALPPGRTDVTAGSLTR